MKRYAVYRTASAALSRRLGTIALVLAAVAFAVKRFGLIEPDVFVLSLIGAAAIALVALALALLALQRIWSHGGRGVPAALAGIVFALVALAPPVLVVGLLAMRPGTQDLSTDRGEPPALLETVATPEQPFLVWFDATLQQHDWYAWWRSRAPGEATADVVSRRYRITPAQLHAAGAKALDNLSWAVVDELPPDLPDTATRLQAQGSSRILGLRHDVALRIRPDPVGALLDVRARSRTALKDLSGNADHIRDLFAEIDRVLLETYGDLSRLAVDESEEEMPLEPVAEPRQSVPLPGFKPYFEDDEAPVPEGLDQGDLEG